MGGGPGCCPSVSWIELGWTIASLVFLGMAVRRVWARLLDLHQARRRGRLLTASARTVVWGNVRRALTRAVIFAIAATIGLLAMATLPGRSIADQVGTVGIFLIVLLLGIEGFADEAEDRRLDRQFDRGLDVHRVGGEGG